MSAAVAAAIPLGPVYLVTYVLVAALVYFVVALALGLPLPGAVPPGAEEDAPAPEYRGRGGVRDRQPRSRPRPR